MRIERTVPSNANSYGFNGPTAMNNLLNPQKYSWLIRKHPKIIMNLRIEKAQRQGNYVPCLCCYIIPLLLTKERKSMVFRLAA